MNPQCTSGVMEDRDTDAHRNSCIKLEDTSCDSATEIVNYIFSITHLRNSFRQMLFQLSGNTSNICGLGMRLISLICPNVLPGFCFYGYVCYNHWNSVNTFVIHAREENGK